MFLARDHIVVSGHPAASLAAMRILDRGGSAADAAVAAGAVLAVVLPVACSLGGDAFILAHDAATGDTEGLNASGAAPAATDVAAFATGIPAKGPLAITMPGVVGGWQALHRRFGRLPWDELFHDAIDAATAGFAVSPGFAQASRMNLEDLAADPGCRSLFLAAGKPLDAGAVLKQPALAASLRLIAETGAAAFYDGPIAAQIAAAVERQGGALRAADFAGYAPEWVTPIAGRYGPLTIRVMPPNSFGLYMLLQLAALDGQGLAGLDILSDGRFALLIAAAEAAFAEGRPYVADPAAAPPPVEAALGPAMTARLRSRMRTPRTPAVEGRGGTAVIMVVDRAGNAVNLVQSVFTLFGSAVADPATGIVLNDRMLGFTTEAGHPNAVAPSKRPAHTLNPVMAFDGDGRLRYVLGTPGGPGQTITLTQVLSAIVDGGLDIAAAVEAPRWTMERPGTPMLETDVPETVRRALNDAGVGAVTAAPGSPYFGSAQVIERRGNGILAGAVDRRREGFALGA